MGRNNKTKSIKFQGISIARKPVSDTTFPPLSLLSGKKRPLTRPKTQATRRKCLKQLSSKLRSACYSSCPSSCCSLKGRPEELVVPTPHSIIKEITDLEWMFGNEIGECFNAWDTIEKIKQKNISNQEQSVSSRPSWSQAPTSCPYRSVRKSLHQLHWAWTPHIDLQIPSSWSVFDNVDWMQDGTFWLGSADSEALEGASSGSSGSPPAQESPRASSRPAHFKPTITCRGESLTRPRGRGQWNTFATMVPHKFNWKYQTHERALRRDKAHHTGYVDLNQYARNYDIWPQNSFPSVISHWEATLCRDHLTPVNELSWPCMIGRWLATVVATDMFPAQCEQLAKWPRTLKTYQTFPYVDYTCRATPQSIGWREEMCPILFAAQYDPDPHSSQCSQYSAARKLASVFQPTMAILILYYLDTRVNTDDPMPPWMVLFGIHYNESGVLIRRHSPCFQPSIPYRLDVKVGWRATSSVVNASHQWDMIKSGQHRGPLLNTLNRIQGHCAHVLGHLKAWDGYERACKLLML